MYDYYPFGGTLAGTSYQRLGAQKNRFKYNGKELQDELDLNWYDYGERLYDAALGRWQVIDRLAINFVNYSPYNYALDNPIRYVDPDGASPYDILMVARYYLGTYYEFGGKNPYYVGGEGISYQSARRIAYGMANNYKWGERFTGEFGQLVVPRQQIYRSNAIEVPRNYTVGIDCSGLSTLAFNSDPEELMDDIPDGATNQLNAFKNADKDGKGKLHSDFNNIWMGDLVFVTNKKGTAASHVMVATGQARYDSDGNVIAIQVIHAPGKGDEVRYKWKDVQDNYKIGHTYRSTGHDSRSGNTWREFWNWVGQNNLWNLITTSSSSSTNNGND